MDDMNVDPLVFPCGESGLQSELPMINEPIGMQ